MKRFLKNKLVLLVGSVMLTIALVNWGINLRCSKIFTALLSNSEVVEAFHNGNNEDIKLVAQENRLAYQKVEKGDINYSSEAWLPKPSIVNYRLSFSEDVILQNTEDRIKNRVFYRIYRGASVYIMVPICTSDCYTEMYLVYKKAIL